MRLYNRDVDANVTAREVVNSIEERLPELRALFSSAGVVAAYLHGSCVEGCAGPASDVDFAVLLPRTVPPAAYDSAAARLTRDLARLLDFPNVDVRVLNHTAYYFQYRVTKTGLCVYARDDDERADYEAWAAMRWCDFQWHQDIFDRAVRERIEEGTFGR